MALEAGIVVLAIIYLLAGIAFLFYGLKVFVPILFMAGSYFGSILGISIMANFQTTQVVVVVVVIAFALLFGCLALWLWRFGLIILGMLGGYNLAIYILAWKSNGLIESQGGRIGFLVAMALVGGILIFFFERWLVIIVTSIIGANLILFGVDGFAQIGYQQALSAFWLQETKYTIVENGSFHGLMISFIVLAVLGILVQALVTGRDVKSIRKE